MASFSFELAQRFRRSKKQSGFTSFISASSTFGIGLGCAVLIIMLSVMNGFERELENSLLAYIPHGELFAVDSDGLNDWARIIPAFEEHPNVDFIQPYAKVTGLAQKGKLSKAVDITAIDPAYANKSKLIQRLEPAQWSHFQINRNSIILGKNIMDKLSLIPGDQVHILVPKAGNGQIAAPESIWLTVVGSISLGGELDSFLGFMHLNTASQVLDISAGAQGIQLYFHDPFKAPDITRHLGYQLNQHAYMSDWTRTQGHLYQDIKLVRFVVYVALTLVIAVACFNIVSSLVMAVNERKPEIAMLKTMGAESSLIISTFIWQGIINGIIGISIGCLLGVLIAINLTEIAVSVEQMLNIKMLSGDVYFIDFLPSELQIQDIVSTVIIALILCCIATIYPALKAANVNPAQILGH